MSQTIDLSRVMSPKSVAIVVRSSSFLLNITIGAFLLLQLLSLFLQHFKKTYVD